MQKMTSFTIKKSKFLEFYLIGFLLILVIYLGEFSLPKEITDEPKSNSIFLIIANIVLFFVIFKKQKRIVSSLLFNKLFLLYLTTLFVLIFFRIDKIKELRSFIHLLLTYLLVFQVSSIMHSIEFVKLVKYLSNYLTIVLLLCLLVFLNNYGQIYFFEHKSASRLGGLFFFGSTAIIAGFCMLINVFLYSRKVERLFTAFKILFSFIILLATDTRMVILITILSSVFILFWERRKMILTILIIGGISFNMYNVMTEKDKKSQVEDDYEFRTLIWGTTIIKIRDRFLIGYGQENPFENMLKSKVDYLQDPHSAYLSIVLRQGIIAAALLFLFYYKKLKENFNVISILVLYYFLSVIVGTELFLGNLEYINVLFNITLFGLLLHPDMKILRHI